MTDSVCWRGECRAGCAYDPHCGMSAPARAEAAEAERDALRGQIAAVESERDEAQMERADIGIEYEGLERGYNAQVQNAQKHFLRAGAAEARADALAEQLAAVEALADGPHTLINDCGMSVQWVDPVSLRAALADPGEALRADRERVWDDGYNDAATMARCYGHTDHWTDEPTNPYRREGDR